MGAVLERPPARLQRHHHLCDGEPSRELQHPDPMGGRRRCRERRAEQSHRPGGPHLHAVRGAMNVKSFATPSLRTAQSGFTLVELMIAMTIALFLAGGLVTLVDGMKRAALSQDGISQLQDNERMAATLMSDVIQSAGYFPSPTINTAASVLPVTGPFTFAGQSIIGTGAG